VQQFAVIEDPAVIDQGLCCFRRSHIFCSLQVFADYWL
jgi:hypothetical protein